MDILVTPKRSALSAPRKNQWQKGCKLKLKHSVKREVKLTIRSKKVELSGRRSAVGMQLEVPNPKCSGGGTEPEAHDDDGDTIVSQETQIARFLPGSVAERSGFRIGDIITKVDNKDVGQSPVDKMLRDLQPVLAKNLDIRTLPCLMSWPMPRVAPARHIVFLAQMR